MTTFYEVKIDWVCFWLGIPIVIILAPFILPSLLFDKSGYFFPRVCLICCETVDEKGSAHFLERHPEAVAKEAYLDGDISLEQLEAALT